MAYRLVNPLPQFFTVDGKVLAGGNLYFTDTGTSNPRPTYADPDLSAENTNPVILDASGRPNADIWMDGIYRVVLKDASGATIWTRDDVKGPADLPGLAGNAGYFLSTNGEDLVWLPVQQVPDVGGQSGKVLTNDGETPFWQNPASSGIPALVAGKFLTNDGTSMSWADVGGSSSTSNSFTVGGLRVMTGTGSAPSNGSRATEATISFSPAFSAAPLFVGISVTSKAVCSGGQQAVASVISKSAAGCNVHFDSDDFGQSNATFFTDVPFDWFAIGPA